MADVQVRLEQTIDAHHRRWQVTWVPDGLARVGAVVDGWRVSEVFRGPRLSSVQTKARRELTATLEAHR